MPPTFSYMSEMALRTSEFSESIRRSHVFFCVWCLSHSCSLVQELFNSGISGLPNCRWSLSSVNLAILENTEIQRKYKDVSVIITLLYVCLFLSILMSIWFWRRRNSGIIESRLFFFQARGYNVLTSVPQPFSYILKWLWENKSSRKVYGGVLFFSV